MELDLETIWHSAVILCVFSLWIFGFAILLRAVDSCLRALRQLFDGMK